MVRGGNVEQTEQFNDQSDIIAISIELDNESYVENWGMYTGGKPTPGSYVIGLHKDHQFFNDPHVGSYKYDTESNNFIRDPDRIITLEKRTKVLDLNHECETQILVGFEYTFQNVVYHVSYDREAQSNFETTKELFTHNLLNSINWSVTCNNEKTTIQLTELDFLQLYVYSSLIKQYKLTHYRERLLPALAELDTLESVQAFNWESVTPAPLPDIPEIDSNGDGEVSQEEFDQMQEELEQAKESVKLAMAKSEQTESALLEAITLIFDSMPMG